MAKIAKSIVALILPFAVIIGSLNYVIDPGTLFNREAEQTISEILITGSRAAVPRKFIGFDERLFQKELISRLLERKDILVLGSSRTRYVTSELFENETLQNSSVAAASLEDFIALYGMYKERGLVPKKLYLSLDHWILDKDAGYTNWRVISSEYATAAENMGLEIGPLPDPVPLGQRLPWHVKIREVFSIAYFQQALDVLMAQGLDWDALRISPTEQAESFGGIYIINPDGSFGDQKEPATVEAVQNLVETVDDGISPLLEIDSRLRGNLEGFLDAMDNDGVEVELLLVPFHPFTYKAWSEGDSHGILKAEAYFRDLAKRKGIRIKGSYDAAKIPASREQFRDWVHPHRPVLETIVMSD